MNDDVLMYVSLAAVLVVGITTILITGHSMTGYVVEDTNFSYTIGDYVDLNIGSGDGFNSSFTAAIALDPVVPSVTFDSFGVCSSCFYYNITASPYDENYGGLAGNNQIFRLLQFYRLGSRYRHRIDRSRYIRSRS